MCRFRLFAFFLHILYASAYAAQGLAAEPLADGSGLQAIWATGPLAGSPSSHGYSVAAAADGSIYLAGTLSGKRDSSFGDDVSARGGSGNQSAFIAKYDASGEALWARSTTEGSADSRFDSVAVDAKGNAYAAGMVSAGRIAFGNGVALDAGYEGENMLLIKFDPQGKAQWARGLSKNDGPSRLYAVAVTSDGCVLVAGCYGFSEPGTFEIGPPGPGYVAPKKMSEGGTAFVAKLNSSGYVLWAAQSLSTSSGEAHRAGSACFLDVAVGPSGDVYASGYIASEEATYFGNSVQLNPNTITSPLLVRYDSAGKALWAKTLKDGPKYGDETPDYAWGPDTGSFGSVSVDAEGNSYPAGEITRNGLYDFGDGVTLRGSSKRTNPLLLKYDAKGKALWARSLESGSGSFVFHAAAIDEKGIYLAGEFDTESKSETFAFGQGLSVTFDPRFMFSAEFLLSYGLSGIPLKILMPPAKNGTIVIRSMASLPGDGLLLAGMYHARENPLDLGNSVQLANAGEYLHFVAKYRSTPSGSRVSPSSTTTEPKAGAGQASDQILSATCIDVKVRVRAAPNLQAETRGYLVKGDRVAVLEKSAQKMKIEGMDEYWYRVKRIADGLEGWSYGRYLEIGEYAGIPTLSAILADGRDLVGKASKKEAPAALVRQGSNRSERSGSDSPPLTRAPADTGRAAG